MPLLLIDLDNTLVDRDTVFRGVVAAFLADHRLPRSDVDWAMAGRYGRSAPAAAIRALLDNGGADRVSLARDTESVLANARNGGWTCVIVTNGRTSQQERKIRNTGLDRLVEGRIVSRMRQVTR